MAFVRKRVGKTGIERFLGIYNDLDGELWRAVLSSTCQPERFI